MDDTRSSAMRRAASRMLSARSICTGARLIRLLIGAVITLPDGAGALGAAALALRGSVGNSIASTGCACAACTSAALSMNRTWLGATATACRGWPASVGCAPAPNSSPGCSGQRQPASGSVSATLPASSQPRRSGSSLSASTMSSA